MTRKLKAHEWLLMVAVDDEFRITETAFAKDGAQYEITRRASLKERLSAAKDAAAYFTPSLKAIDHSINSNVSKLTDEELEAELQKAMKALGGLYGKEEKAKDSGRGSKAKGPDSAGAVGEPDQQATDGNTQEDQAAQ